MIPAYGEGPDALVDPLTPAVRFRGLWYRSTCCHSCALKEAVRSEGMTLDDFEAAVEAGEDFQLGHETKGGEFTITIEL